MRLKILLFSGIIWTSVMLPAQTINPYITVDQFGYLPESQKIAVIKDPQTGFDSAEAYSPGNKFIVVNALSGDHLFYGQPIIWNDGKTDVSSGDKAWHFDFSAITHPGSYYLLDSANNQRSFAFDISSEVYKEILKHAVRTFFYQRVGFAKDAQYAGAAWADGASHIGPLQDKNCRLYNAKTNAATERDLSGGWYDAGDFNKYTNWTAGYVVEMAKAYLENPGAWGDDYNIPESGNGIPDLLDEAKWGIDHLLRMQQPDGSVLCIVGESHASPPSNATGQSVYGPATTSASLNTAAAFAIAAKAFRAMNLIAYSDTLVTRAEIAWDWAVANPAVIFHNNSASNGSQGVGAGDQEEGDYDRSMSKLEAACFLYGATQKKRYRDYFNSQYRNAHMMQWNYVFPYEPSVQDLLLYYTKLPGATPSISTEIRNTYKNSMVSSSDNFPAFYSIKDPYLAHNDTYTWGSNATKGAMGNMYGNMIVFNLDPSRNQDVRKAAQGYIHYLHGVNPLSLVYLSNMYAYGGDNCVNEFYHTWFCNGSAKWDRVGQSLYGPAPGYITGGPNSSYNWDGCCPGDCGSTGNNAACTSESISPPKDQPKQKSYKDFNTSWPLNSWSVTENSCGYQVNYLKLLSKFVHGYDCHGDSAGTAYLDTCGICSDGNTGRLPETEPCNCPDLSKKSQITVASCEEYVSPSGNYIWEVSGIYTDTIDAANGCDSIITIRLTVNQHSASLQVIEACDALISPSGRYTWTMSGNYTDTIPNKAGCDSIISIDLNIKHSTQSELTVTTCDFYLSPGGKKWTQSGQYTDTLTNAAGCDSIIAVNLTIPVVNVAVSQSEDTLFAEAVDAAYRWLQCSNNFAVINGANQRKFTPAATGEYAVEVTQDECIDTSGCYSVIITGILSSSFVREPEIFPNPTSSDITVIMPEVYEQVDVELKNLGGQIVFKETIAGKQRFTLSFPVKPGIYLLGLRNNLNQQATVKLVVH